MADAYEPTPEQRALIDHEGSAFVTACPGAGKTRTLVERVRVLLAARDDRRGVAILSFTNAAADELRSRMASYGVLPSPLFPSFVGTFDSFLWVFFITPFGIPNCDKKPVLAKEKTDWQIWVGGRSLSLDCFDRRGWKINVSEARRVGIPADQHREFEEQAKKVAMGALRRGLIDYEDIRACVAYRLKDVDFAGRLATALAGRFKEVVVDEAQDCNKSDLNVVRWLRNAGISVKVVCDPNQAIYSFRGGVEEELTALGKEFETCLQITGNFRSTPEICNAISALRSPALRSKADTALGPHRALSTKVHIISYAGAGISTAIGPKFTELVLASGLEVLCAPALSSAREAAPKAMGQTGPINSAHLTLNLASAIVDFHSSSGMKAKLDALQSAHHAVLRVGGRVGIDPKEYREYLEESKQTDDTWRPDVVRIVRELAPRAAEQHEDWVKRAQTLLGPYCPSGVKVTVKLKNDSQLAAILSNPPESHPTMTIHAAKGLEFPAVCVVLVPNVTQKILDFLEGKSTDDAESVRKIYVAASRAQRLLAFAVPKGQRERLEALLSGAGCAVEVHEVKAGS